MIYIHHCGEPIDVSTLLSTKEHVFRAVSPSLKATDKITHCISCQRFLFQTDVNTSLLSPFKKQEVFRAPATVLPPKTKCNIK